VEEFYSNGKLLLTGEYLILRGARGLALPTSRGQRLSVSSIKEDVLQWVSFDHEHNKWFEAIFNQNSVLSSSNDDVAQRLFSLIKAAIAQDPSSREKLFGSAVEARLEFPKDWGLGSSSTLVHSFSDWLDLDPFDLLDASFGGSGYDIAVAMERAPILFERHEGEPYHEEVEEWNPLFADQLWFIHLNKKENTSKAVNAFLADEERGYAEIPAVNALTQRVVDSRTLSEFEAALSQHNVILSRVLERPNAQEEFSEYTAGITKYLGAWGGDFMLATGDAKDMDFFKAKGLTTILSYADMILENKN